MFGHLQAKFDVSKTGLCRHCQVEDTHEHRVRFCPLFAAIRKDHQWVCDAWPALPLCLTHHLLPPVCPLESDVRAYLHSISDFRHHIVDFHPSAGRQHLFTDGSCLYPTHPTLALASWAVVTLSVPLMIVWWQKATLQVKCKQYHEQRPQPSWQQRLGAASVVFP